MDMSIDSLSSAQECLFADEDNAGDCPAGSQRAAIRNPTKEQVRAWLSQRLARRAPLPSLEQIRHELGWTLADR